MSQFLTPLEVENIDDLKAGGRGIWRVITTFQYRSDILGRVITIEPGFLTDFASVPRVPFLYWFFGDTSHKASVIHDWLYHHHEICDETTANQVLREAMKVEKEPWWRIGGIYLGVALGGESSWEADGGGSGHTMVNGRVV